MNILLADDHALVRAGLRAILSAQTDITVIGEAADGRAALSLAYELRPDVILLDIAMPGLNGLETLTRLRETLPNSQVIVLSMHATEEYVVGALRAGAMSYLLKDAPPQDLFNAIRAAHKGERYLCPPLNTEIVTQYMDRLGASSSPVERLTPREREVLQLLAEGHTTQEIAQTLTLSPKTVEAHRANLMQKLDVYDIASLTRFAIRMGIIK